MPKETDDQELIEAFFDALRVNDLGKCQALLKSLESLSGEQPALGPWCRYLAGILAFEIANDWAEAERLFTELLQTELEPSLRVRVWYALGRSLDVQGRWEEAIAAFAQSLSIAVELGQPSDKAKAWKHMAISYRKAFTQGDFGPEALQQAIEYYRLALDELRPITNPSPEVAWLTGSVWNALGLAYRDLGQLELAIVCYQHDLAICRELGDRFGVGLSYGNLGEIYQKLGPAHWPEALSYYQRALSIIREFDNRYEETEARVNLAFLHQEMGECDAALDYYSQAIQLIEGLRAGISSEAARAGFFATIVDTYANMVLLCLATGREPLAYDYVERARARAFLDVLAAGDSGPEPSQAAEARPMVLSEVQSALPGGTLLLEYFTTGLAEARLGRDAGPQGVQRHRFPQARTLIFAITRDEIQIHDTGLDPNALRPSQLDSAVERHFLAAGIRRRLYERLIAPVEGLLQDKDMLYLVPHGPLHYIPFQALVAPDGDTLLREGGPQLIYAPSATLLLRHRPEESGRSLAPCLALGYNDQGDRALRFAEDEARSIAQITGGRALLGPSVKKVDLYSQAENYRLLHFSCHGDFDPETPLASAMRLAPGESLTAREVMECLRLRCELVTLSACESGLSRVRRGDELVGFMRAFMVAGTTALVSTLWRVDERSTRILMERFYKQVNNGVSFASALKQAQLYLRDLSRREATDVLAGFIADEILGSAATASKSAEKKSAQAEAVAWQRAQTYLKGMAVQGARDEEERTRRGEDEEKVFADPFYWAPFILVGDQRSVSTELD